MESLSSLNVKQRREQVRKASVCFNCLKPGHIAAKCQRKAQCEKCEHRHHTLLHEDKPSTILSYSCQTANSPATVHLMTAVAEIKGSRRARVRVFLDLGSQATFVSSELVKAIQPKRVGEHTMVLRDFGSRPRKAVFGLYELSVTRVDGQRHIIWAYEKPDLNLGTERVSKDCIKRWESRGVVLSDAHGCDVPDEAHLLLGADSANNFLISKCQFEGEFVWQTELGWVLSGPSASPELAQQSGLQSVSVSCIRSDIYLVERLWQLEEPAPTTKSLPVFPITRNNDRYEVGLLWKSEERPQEQLCSGRSNSQSACEQAQQVWPEGSLRRGIAH